MMNRYPHEFFRRSASTALPLRERFSLDPEVIVADESVSALDVSIKAQVCNLHSGFAGAIGPRLPVHQHDMAVVERVKPSRSSDVIWWEIFEIAPALPCSRIRSTLYQEVDCSRSCTRSVTPRNSTWPYGLRAEKPVRPVGYQPLSGNIGKYRQDIWCRCLIGQISHRPLKLTCHSLPIMM